ncbi:hypothetical protein K458DRAFT_36741 [Lentithecium fluviatile CBS 122367]|uniref:Uncharacterized protein n=1 Tax=Lentithecium fluviatile CBS 122367 TaxID=1168545 RepID=A0A6G1J0M6_9PLEO|nr:hypothetical protein K458DRAFT_36741 [Lentithecium fluviatile CBS 122367]
MTFTDWEIATVTTTITAAAKAKRHTVRGLKPTTTAKELISLKALASNVIATACSCINTTPAVAISNLLFKPPHLLTLLGLIR